MEAGSRRRRLRLLDTYTQYTRILCVMASKTISLRVEAYQRLRRARTHPGESFSDVVMRAHWEDHTATGGELLSLVRERGALYDAAAADAIEDLKTGDRPSEDKWSMP